MAVFVPDKFCRYFLDRGHDNDVSYVMPTVAVNTDALMQELGATDPAKAPVNVTITELTNDDVTLESCELMLPPVEFSVTASYSGKNVDVETFEKYDQRVMEIPDGTDAEGKWFDEVVTKMAARGIVN